MTPEQEFLHVPWPQEHEHEQEQEQEHEHEHEHEHEDQEQEVNDEYFEGYDENKFDRCQIFFKFSSIQRKMWSRDSSVGTATDCGLDDLGVRIRVPVGSRIFSSALRPDRH
jgi:hypothetical protein